MDKEFKAAEERVKQARNSLLKLHKVLMDRDRSVYEMEHGPVSPGVFLEMLLSEPRFEWLRVLSMLIVRIDEAFDLDDGVSLEMLEGFCKEITVIFDKESDKFGDFHARFLVASVETPEAVRMRNEILKAVDWDGDGDS